MKLHVADEKFLLPNVSFRAPNVDAGEGVAG
jgi:hypothetical protein